MQATLRGVPWVLWLQDIVTSAAATTGLVRSRALLGSARGLERRAYRSAARVVVISDAHRRMLVEEGVPAEKLVRIYNPATRPVIATDALVDADETPGLRVLCMGNIGYSQNLPRLVEAFEQSQRLPAGTRLIITGTGELEPEVRARVRTERVEMKGLLPSVDSELDRAAVGLVPQRPDIVEFNLPSKLMNFMARGVPVLASVRPDSETARLVQRSGGGWLTDASDPNAFPEAVSRIAGNPDDRAARGRRARAFAAEHFSADVVADQFERILEQTVARLNRDVGGSEHV
jgi:glycosyltransferase involved in cell wall biosynthesis